MDNQTIRLGSRCRVVLLRLGLLLGLASAVNHALAGEASSEIPLTAAQLVYQTEDGSEIIDLPVSTRVRMQVSGLLNRIEVEQTFRNDTQVWLQGQYQFPLPDKSAVDGMDLWIGERHIEGQIRQKDVARAEFVKARESGRRASLVAQHRPNVFTTDIANLAPGDELKVVIRLLQTVHFDGGTFSLRFPLLVAPRYQPRSGSCLPVEDTADDGLPPARYLPAASAEGLADEQGHSTGAGTVDIQVRFDGADQLGQVNSPYHWVSLVPAANNSLQAELIRAVANRDFVLQWQMADPASPKAVSYRQQGMSYPSASPEIAALEASTDYLLLMLVPPAADKHVEHVARELVLVVDVSGSMAGESILQAKAALLFALSTLGQHDSFNIIAFSDRLSTFAQESVPATAENLQSATNFIRDLSADGGTEMGMALQRALKSSSADKLQQIIFMTDGAVSNEQQLFAMLRNRLADSRLFTVGIGSAPNSFFMERAARLGRGSFTYIGAQGEVNTRMSALMQRIASPVLTNLQLSYEDGTVPEYWPVQIPDLYGDQPITLSIRQAGGRHTALKISGELGMAYGQRRFWQQQLTLPDQAGDKQGLDLIWAREQIAELNLQRDSTEIERRRQQITALALKYHLVSPYTSLVAVETEPSRPQSAEQKLVSTGLMLPDGWQPPSGMHLPQTATDSRGQLLLGTLLLLTGLAGLWFTRRWQRMPC
ncbi:marine proteobacterial sortase target protein [Shewanella sp. GXUN23E]|uniref:marine proteobacterial sortase target protein n=1 Tax=Shewanella sp. GXUN23E TaxID=3422498 RepID=UPI003D7CFA46